MLLPTPSLTGLFACTVPMQIANQGDMLFDSPPHHHGGFLKAIFPCLRTTGGAQGSMAWVKLVDDEGRVAGHAVLSARMSMALLGGQVGPAAGWLVLLAVGGCW